MPLGILVEEVARVELCRDPVFNLPLRLLWIHGKGLW